MLDGPVIVMRHSNVVIKDDSFMWPYGMLRADEFFTLTSTFPIKFLSK
jgi:hypothetical protein